MGVAEGVADGLAAGLAAATEAPGDADGDDAVVLAGGAVPSGACEVAAPQPAASRRTEAKTATTLAARPLPLVRSLLMHTVCHRPTARAT